MLIYQLRWTRWFDFGGSYESPKEEQWDENGNLVEEEASQESNLDQLKKSYLTHKADQVVFISAAKKENMEQLRNTLFAAVKAKHFAIYPNWLDLGYSAVESEE